MNAQASMNESASRHPGGEPEDPIFIVGAPRSGTTWLAKIFDSHPDVLYRHEPDDRAPPPGNVDPRDLSGLLAQWRADRRIRTSTKRPFFPKSWRPPGGHSLRGAIAYGMMASGRLPGLARAQRTWAVPDLGDIGKARLVVKTVIWCAGAATIARELPDSRIVIIVRHPCGQVHSVLRGNNQGRFELRESRTLPYNRQRAMAHAARHGTPESSFGTLADAAKLAWDWAAFNETLAETTAGLGNVMTVLYEDLCEQPEQVARQLLAFTGLSWHPQTAAFVHDSTNASSDGDYYDVVRNPAVAANRWREGMSPDDQRAVRDVARQTCLSHLWPDLSPTQV